MKKEIIKIPIRIENEDWDLLEKISLWVMFAIMFAIMFGIGVYLIWMALK